MCWAFGEAVDRRYNGPKRAGGKPALGFLAIFPQRAGILLPRPRKGTSTPAAVRAGDDDGTDARRAPRSAGPRLRPRPGAAAGPARMAARRHARARRRAGAGALVEFAAGLGLDRPRRAARDRAGLLRRVGPA